MTALHKLLSECTNIDELAYLHENCIPFNGVFKKNIEYCSKCGKPLGKLSFNEKVINK